MCMLCQTHLHHATFYAVQWRTGACSNDVDRFELSLFSCSGANEDRYIILFKYVTYYVTAPQTRY